MIIPDRNLYIVTSALRPTMGVWNDNDRYTQTQQTLMNIRRRDPKAFILLADSSVNPVPDEEKMLLSQLSDLYYDLSNLDEVRHFSVSQMKSQAESALLFHTLMHFKTNNEPILKSCKRIFKISARSLLDESFNAEDHDIFGKYVFKKRIHTWMNPVLFNADHLLITRFFSFCPSLLDNYLTVLQLNFHVLHHLDTEHAHYLNVPKEYLVEFNTLHCMGWLATGQIEHY